MGMFAWMAPMSWLLAKETFTELYQLALLFAYDISDSVETKMTFMNVVTDSESSIIIPSHSKLTLNHVSIPESDYEFISETHCLFINLDYNENSWNSNLSFLGGFFIIAIHFIDSFSSMTINWWNLSTSPIEIYFKPSKQY